MTTDTPTPEVLGGRGILSGAQVHDPEFEQRMRYRDEAAQRAAEKIERTRSQIAAIWTPGLESELAREREPNPHIGKDWGAFTDYCKKWGLPHLPAAPEAIVAFLGQARPADVPRPLRNIRQIHDDYFNHPCETPLVRAIVRQARAGKSSKQPQANGKAN
jgi:hypothetical protein